MRKKVTTLVVVLTLAVLMQVSAYATDYDNHWAKDTIQEWMKKEYMKGDEYGNANPDSNITRAEFAAMVNKVIGCKDKVNITFTDVYADKWYYKDIEKAAAAGYIRGYDDNTFRPDDYVTREDAAIVIARVMYLKAPAGYDASFEDSTQISNWSKESVNAILSQGVMKGYEDNTIRPQKNITRAEAITVIETATKLDIIITEDKTEIKDRKLRGNIIIAEELGEGEATLRGIDTDSDVIVRGGGENTIHLIDTLIKGILRAEKENGKLRIIAEGSTHVENVKIKNGVKIEQKDDKAKNFNKIEIDKEYTEGQKIELSCKFKEISNKHGDVELMSFGKAIKILKDKKYIDDEDLDDIFGWLEKDDDKPDKPWKDDDKDDDDDKPEKPDDGDDDDDKPEKPDDGDDDDKPEKPDDGDDDDDKPEKPDDGDDDDDKPEKPDDGDDDKPEKPDDPDFDFAKGYPYVTVAQSGYYEIKIKLNSDADVYIVEGINDKDDADSEDILHGHRKDALDGYHEYAKAKKDEEITIKTDWIKIQNKMSEMGFYILAVNNKGETEEKDIEILAENDVYQDKTPPTVIKAYLSNNRKKITMLFDESLDNKSLPDKSSFKGIEISNVEIINKYDEHSHLNASGVILTLAKAVTDDSVSVTYEKPKVGGIQDISKTQNMSETFTVEAVKTIPSIEKAVTKGNGEIIVTFDTELNVFAEYKELDESMFKIYDKDTTEVKVISSIPIRYNIFTGYTEYKITHAPTNKEGLTLKYTPNQNGIKTNAQDMLPIFDKKITTDNTAPENTGMTANGSNITLKFNEPLKEKNILPCSFDITINGKSIIPGKTKLTVIGSKIEINIDEIEIEEDDEIQVVYRPKHKTYVSKITDETGNEIKEFTITNNRRQRL